MAIKKLFLCRHKRLWVGYLFAIFASCYFIMELVWIRDSPIAKEEKLNKKSLNDRISKSINAFQFSTTKHSRSNTNQSVILMWSHPWGVETEGIKEETIIGECLFTYDRERRQEAHAVVFHHTAFTYNYVPVPWNHYRHPDQVFIWYSIENPGNIQQFSPHTFDNIPQNFINWTMSYRTDADIFYPYVQSNALEAASQAGSKYVSSILSKKNQMALWVVSNCNKTKSARERWSYVEKLVNAGLPVDRFGKCFNNSNQYVELLSQPDKIASYKFYLAFENGKDCRDYVTEKFWDNALLSGRVPVVWGPQKKDIVPLVPHGSFIHTDDFQSPENLAAYLLYLNRSPIAYRRYFSWMEDSSLFADTLKKYYKHSREESLCLKVRKNKNYASIPNLRKYLFTNDRKACFS